ncbi:ferrochelatase [Moraxella haemolytica]|uniref:ferrochelatase n=1 Tax=Moraxella haemolytica TaxID=2904119 RepID=UPI00254378AA|nr:ferrochelatase [Moraxella sp. ZY171148]WII94833.1 ferrochelatase [Moraxella sp. ZY171148]
MKTAIILVNLGTPDEPTPQAVRRYLREFLSDTRVIEMPSFIWQIILNLFVLTTRPKRVAHAYESVWTDEGSPLLAILKAQASQLEHKLFEMGKCISVFPATTYGNPNIKQVLQELQAKGYDDIIVLSLYPQYSATTTAAVFDKVADYCKAQRHMPAIQFVGDYHDHPLYIQALAGSIRRFWAVHGRAERLLMSFHGIPKPYVDKGDPYAEQCHRTATLVAGELGLNDDEWAISFQSRFGAQEWLKPYTDELLTQWGAEGLSVQVLSPAFSADCLETLEELAVENRDNFMNAGGKSYQYIPALNTDERHIQLLVSLVGRYLS